MAEAHPVGFQWVMEAKRRGATIIHVDPRFTRTSAVADLHVPIRAGSDIAFLGALVNHVLSNDLDFREYVVAYTNAAAIIDEDFQDTEDLDGLFSGFDTERNHYDPTSWQYEGAAAAPSAGQRDPAQATGPTATGPGRGVLHKAATRRRSRSRTAPAGRPSATSRSATRRCRTRGASSRSSSATSPATPPRWCRRSAASARSSSARSPTR